jgi:hypothetical protein
MDARTHGHEAISSFTSLVFHSIPCGFQRYALTS